LQCQRSTHQVHCGSAPSATARQAGLHFCELGRLLAEHVSRRPRPSAARPLSLPARTRQRGRLLALPRATLWCIQQCWDFHLRCQCLFCASLGLESADAASLARWRVDYLKYDSCIKGKGRPMVQYPPMVQALQGTGKDIYYSVCELGRETLLGACKHEERLTKTPQERAVCRVAIGP